MTALSRLSGVDVSGRRTYDLIDEPTGKDYSGLLEAAISKCNQAVVVRTPANDKDAEALARLAPFLQSPPTARTLRYAFTKESARVFSSLTDHLYGWMQPDLPENLCLFREDGSPWLVSVAQQKLAYLELTPFEKLLLSRMAPTLGASLAYEAASDAIMVYFERRWEDAQAVVAKDLVAYVKTLMKEGRDGVVEAIRDWLLSKDPEREQIALTLISELELQDLWEETNGLLETFATSKVDISPQAFRAHPVLRDRWRTRYISSIQSTLDTLEAADESAIIDDPRPGAGAVIGGDEGQETS